MICLTDFENAQPFATRFFTQALTSQHLVNAYVLKGKDLPVMYRMALRLAQIINCEDKPSLDAGCGQCQPCRWIGNNAHPGVITLSNLTYSPPPPETKNEEPKSREAKTEAKSREVIVVDQLKSLLHELAHHSGGFHRVVILTGAEESNVPSLSEFTFPPPGDWEPKKSGQFHLLPLNPKIFAETPANKFLKTLEEPPLDTLFFLLTDSETKLLETIVSRCQTVPFVTPKAYYDTPLSDEAQTACHTLLSSLPQGDYIRSNQLFSDYIKDQSLTSKEALEELQHYLKQSLQQSLLTQPQYLHIRRSLERIEVAKRMLQGKVREDVVLEDLFLQLVQQ